MSHMLDMKLRPTCHCAAGLLSRYGNLRYAQSPTVTSLGTCKGEIAQQVRDDMLKSWR